MSSLPFSMSFSRASRTGELAVSVELAKPVRDSGHPLPVLLWPVKVLADLGGVGGVAGDRFPPASSSLNLLQNAQISDRKLQWSLRHKNVDPRVVNVLANVLHFAHVKICPIGQAWVEASPDLFTGRDTNELPPMFLPPPFAFVDLREEPEPTFTIEVIFHEEHPEDILRHVETAFGKWFTAAGGGAFLSQTYTPDVCKIYLGADPVYAGDRLVLYLEDMIVSEAEALASLLNVFQWAHAHVAPIKEVQFYL